MLNIIEKCKAGDVIRLTVYTTKGETKEYNVKLMTNMGTSSYTKEIVQEQNGNSSGYDGNFDFPFGE